MHEFESRPGPDEVLSTLRHTLKSLRKKRGLTQAQLAKAADITRNHYQLLEAGGAATGAANPTLHTLIALARELGVSLSELFSEALAAYSVWRWLELDHNPTDDERQSLWDALMDESERHVGSSAANAFVGSDGTSVTLGIVLSATGEAGARANSGDAMIRVLHHAGFSAATATLTQDIEVSSGTADLAGPH